MFKVGDIVYCINNVYGFGEFPPKTFFDLYLDTRYTVKRIEGDYIVLRENNSYQFNMRFVSEKDYKINKRKNKINKIKECLK